MKLRFLYTNDLEVFREEAVQGLFVLLDIIKECVTSSLKLGEMFVVLVI